jgi:hypothetical protein
MLDQVNGCIPAAGGNSGHADAAVDGVGGLTSAPSCSVVRVRRRES